MAGKQFKDGPFGWYYPHKDSEMDTKSISVKNYYREFIEPGLLTPEMMEDMLGGKQCVIQTTKNGAAVEAVFHIEKYTWPDNGRRGKKLLVEYRQPGTTQPVQDNDIAVIKSHAQDMINYFVDHNCLSDFYSLQRYITELADDKHEITAKRWRVYHNFKESFRLSVGTLDVSIYDNRKNELHIYGKIVLNTSSTNESNKQYISGTVITEDEYKKLCDDRTKEKADHQAKLVVMRMELKNYIYNLRDTLYDNGKPNYTEIEAYIQGATEMPSVLKYKVEDMLRKCNKSIYNILTGLAEKDMPELFTHRYSYGTYYFNGYSYDEDDPEVKNKIKNDIKRIVAVAYRRIKCDKVRSDLYDEIKAKGLTEVVEPISIDLSCDLGKFKEAKKIILKEKNKNNKDVELSIVYSAYKDIEDADELKTKLLNLLKVYDDFWNFPEKEKKAIAKFIAVHKLKDYYDKIEQWPDVLETVMDFSLDTGLKKRLLSGIAGTSRALSLKDKTYYFERRAWLNNTILLYKPIELLERLRKLIPVYNAGSNAAILTNIELDKDESFIFQFYTYANKQDGKGEFDGRRLQYVTKIYNERYPNETIGFRYDNGMEDEVDK